VRHRFTGKDVRPVSVRIREPSGRTGIVEIVVQLPSLTADPMFHADARRKLLVGASEPRAAKRVQYDGFLQFVGERSTFIDQSPRAEHVRRHRGPPPEERMVVERQRLRRLRLKKLRPSADLILFANMKRVALQLSGCSRFENS